MTKRLVSVLLIAIFLVSMMPIFVKPSLAILPDYEAMRLEPEFRERDMPIDFSSISEVVGPGHHSYYTVGDVIYWLAADFEAGYYFFDTFELKAIGPTAEIWVQQYRDWLPGDLRPYPEILDAQVAYLLDQFENNIFPTDSGYFGTPDYHDGTYSLLDAWGNVPPGYYNESDRNVILVSNIRDESYYNSSYPYYVAGFYSPSFEAYFDRNVISIDSWQWEERMGEEGYEWIPGIPVDRPYLYEMLIAHEYQHLIHDDYNPDDGSWMNEACSMFAELLCYNEVDWSSVNSYLATPDNSLLDWGDQGDINILADYGQALLWAAYLNDNYGEDFNGRYVQAGIPDVEGIEAALDYFGYTESFFDVYHDFRLANLLHTNFPGCGKYNYRSFDLNEADPIRTYEVSGLPVPWTRASEEFGNTITTLGYDTGITTIGRYGSDYIMFNDWCRFGKISFNGDDLATDFPTWTFTDGMWYSRDWDLMNTIIFGSAYVDPADPTLEVDTWWDIEPYWDFGFVQVSTDDGATWISLENAYTTYDHDPAAHPDVVANLPGLTGSSEGWLTISFDLSAYADETVLIGFLWITDWATTLDGWYISQARVSGTPVDLALPVTDWDADFLVTVVYAFVICHHTFYIPYDMWLCDATEIGMTFGVVKPSYTVLIVSNISEEGHVDYEFQASRIRLFGGCWCNVDRYR